jgi:hypothetical protein
MRDKTKSALDAPDAIGVNNFFSNHSRLLFLGNLRQIYQHLAQ